MSLSEDPFKRESDLVSAAGERYKYGSLQTYQDGDLPTPSASEAEADIPVWILEALEECIEDGRRQSIHYLLLEAVKGEHKTYR